MNFSGTMEPLLSLKGFPKLIIRRALTLAWALSLNSPVVGSNKVIGRDSSDRDQVGDPSGRVEIGETMESLHPCPIMG